jgi:hypothetical protein
MELALVSYTGGNTKRGRLVKGSQEAKDYMARIRAMRKPKTATAPKRRGRPPKTPIVAPAPIRDVAALLKRANFRQRVKPRGRPRKDAKLFDPTVYPTTAPALIRDVAALLKRANFRQRVKPRGRPRKDAKVFYGY